MTHDGIKLSGDINRSLLGLYECAISPDRYPDYARDLEYLFAVGPNTETVKTLERHSETIWNRASETFFPSEASNDPLECLLEIGKRAPFDANVDDYFDNVLSDDLTRLRDLIEGVLPTPQIIVRSVPTGHSSIELHHAIRDDGVVRIYKLTNDLSQEVERLLTTQFCITSSELQVLRGVVAGQSIKDLARSNRKSIETIRTQLKSAAGKLGLSRQTEIVAAINSLSRATGQSGTTLTNSATSITLRDGRSLSYAVDGDLKGSPVLFFHDFSSSCWWPKSVASQFAATGLLVISAARAGFGSSSVNPLQKRPCLMNISSTILNLWTSSNWAPVTCWPSVQGLGSRTRFAEKSPHVSRI